MDGILAIPRLFKYAKAEIAITILEKKTLKWSSPDLFNDPFEFKSPLEYGFEWDEMMEVALQRFGAILTQIEDPIVATGHPAREQSKCRAGAPPVAQRRNSSTATSYRNVGC
jgi:hypothetical protein